MNYIIIDYTLCCIVKSMKKKMEIIVSRYYNTMYSIVYATCYNINLLSILSFLTIIL